MNSKQQRPLKKLLGIRGMGSTYRIFGADHYLYRIWYH